MTDLKRKVMLEEIKEYLEYDSKLKDFEKSELLQLNSPYKNPWMQVIYDYFFSHIDEDGNILSLENYIIKYDCDKEYYKKVNEEFVSCLFEKEKPLFFLDVDNTLTNFAHLSDEKKEFISNYIEKKRVILTTGKTYESILNVVDDCKLHENYASTLNGSILIDKGEMQIISKIGSVSKDISDELNKTNINYIIYYKDSIHIIKDLNEDNERLLKKYNEWYVDDGKEIDFNNIIKILTFIYEGEEEKEELVKEIISKYDGLVSMRTAGHCYEILRKDQHKGNTIKKISKLMGRYYRTSVGVGDSMNDLPLLNYVGIPYVVSTASEELKSYGFDELEENRDVDIVNLIKKYN